MTVGAPHKHEIILAGRWTQRKRIQCARSGEARAPEPARPAGGTERLHTYMGTRVRRLRVPFSNIDTRRVQGDTMHLSRDFHLRRAWTPRRAARGRRTAVGVALATATVAALAASPASASTLTLACQGPGGRNTDSAGTVLCAAPAGRARTLIGHVLNDAGVGVAATVTITRSIWIINAGNLGYTVKPTSTSIITAKADGTFTFASNPATRDSFKVEVGALPALGIAGGSFARAEVHRQLSLKIKKLGGGAVRLTVRGTSPRNVKAQVTSADGYAIPGQRAKRLDGHGQVTFRLGARATGTYSVYIVRSPLTDLFWDTGKPPKFRLSSGR
jgi:hypothetical protein